VSFYNVPSTVYRERRPLAIDNKCAVTFFVDPYRNVRRPLAE